MVALDLLEQLQTVKLAALQPDVEEYQVGAAVGDFRQCAVAIARGARGEAFVLEDARHQIANIGLVIDDENVICHGMRSVFVRSVSCRSRRWS